jgi:hypothetical protein
VRESVSIRQRGGPTAGSVRGSGRCSRSPEFVPLNVIRIPVGLEKCSQSSGIDVHGSRNRCSRWPGIGVHDRPEYAKTSHSVERYRNELCRHARQESFSLALVIQVDVASHSGVLKERRIDIDYTHVLRPDTNHSLGHMRRSFRTLGRFRQGSQGVALG